MKIFVVDEQFQRHAAHNDQERDKERCKTLYSGGVEFDAVGVLSHFLVFGEGMDPAKDSDHELAVLAVRRPAPGGHCCGENSAQSGISGPRAHSNDRLLALLAV